MKTLHTTAKINANGQLTVDIPVNMPQGEYQVVLVVEDRPFQNPNAHLPTFPPIALVRGPLISLSDVRICMVMTGANAIFIDTNILVYASVANTPLHTTVRQTLENFSADGINLWISRQVLREYLSTLSRPQTYSNPLPVLTLVADIEYFQNQFLVAEDSSQVTQNLLTLVQQVTVAGRQIHDANIVATMQTHNIPQLLTHNIADFKRFAHLITLLPLAKDV